MPKINIFEALGEALNPHTNDTSEPADVTIYADVEIDISDHSSLETFFVELYKIEIEHYTLNDLKISTDYEGGQNLTVYVQAEINLDYDLSQGFSLSEMQEKAEQNLQSNLTDIIDNLILNS